MNFNNIHNDDGFGEARRIIEEAQRNRPLGMCCVPNNNGITGPIGEDAETPTLTIGTVTTGAPGTDADASITGTAPNFILNLTIPQGPTGATGPTGEDAETPTLTIGTVTTGEPGTDADASITGTAPNFILNLTIPQGPTGATGPTGEEA